MELRINDSVLISELQNQFNKEFPYLKIEFFYEPYSRTKSTVHIAQKKLGACRKKHNEGTIHITPENTVEKLKNILRNEFGLIIEVFRMSGNLWIETSLTDSWTLKSQNEQGEALSVGTYKNKDA